MNFFCILVFTTLKFVSKGIIDNTSALVQVMAWHQTGDKHFSGPMMTKFYNDMVSLGYKHVFTAPSCIMKYCHPQGVIQGCHAELYAFKYLIKLSDYDHSRGCLKSEKQATIQFIGHYICTRLCSAFFSFEVISVFKKSHDLFIRIPLCYFTGTRTIYGCPSFWCNPDVSNQIKTQQIVNYKHR